MLNGMQLPSKKAFTFDPVLTEAMTDSEFTVEADVPKFEPHNLDVKVDNDGFLVVSGKRNTRIKSTGERIHREFYFSVGLDDSLDPKKLKWNVENNKLKVAVGKR